MEIRNYGKGHQLCEVPLLTRVQRSAYERFLQGDVLPEERKDEGLEGILRETFPVSSYDESMKLKYLYYELGEPRHTPEECRDLGLTYEAPLKVRLRLDKEEPVEEDVYLGGVPIMLGGGEFVVNGAERTVVCQIQRSPGVDFSEDIHASGKRLHVCRLIPARGSWIQMEATSRDLLVVRLDRSGKIPATTFLRALSEEYSTTAQILRAFYPTKTVKTSGAKDKLKGAVLVEPVADPETGEIKAEAGTVLGEPELEFIHSNKIKTLEIVDATIRDPLLINTVGKDETHSREEALVQIYSRLRPGNPPQVDKAKALFTEFFADQKRLNFGTIGRFRINRKFDHGVPADSLGLTKEDFFCAIKYILALRTTRPEARIDDIDHLENRRVRTIRDLLTDEFRKGMLKLKRSVRERMSLKDAHENTPRGLVNSQTVSSAIEYFFARGELSQVVDQSNPLSQLTHERRLSALGPGGLNRKRAGFEVRDVHTSHYGRICPIETPEGTNIGLIVSLSIFAGLDDYGFLTTPYAKVKNRTITKELVHLRADQEAKHCIAQADVETDAKGRIKPKTVTVRHQDDVTTVSADEVDLVDVSPMQLVGVAASLIPFLEHDDANRALMGSNMQRQAVPLVRPEAPTVATGREGVVARNTSMVVCAEENGKVSYADALKIVVQPPKGEPRIYRLKKHIGLNDRTCLNQKPIVKVGDNVEGGQPLTDGAATSSGELALGRNVLVAFMPWEGWNFEDAILASENLLKEDAFTSIHIEEFKVEIRETKLGREEITRDIPNVSETALRNLDENGLIRIGTKVKPGDTLAGKIAPKSKSELTSEEKLLYAIFGRAGEDVKNDSLEVKPGCGGHVIDVKHFRRTSPVSKEERRALQRRAHKVETEYNDQIADIVREKFKALKGIASKRLVNEETGEVYRVTDQDPDADVIATNAALDLDKVGMHSSTRHKAKIASLPFDKRIRALQVEEERVIAKLKRGDELPTGVLELVKVYVAMKRRLSVGDKMAGRHGNKGVVSRILPEEDMPFLPDGRPVDMVLNPLGVPSRMNFGQILETHLGWAAKELGFRAITPVFDGAKEKQIREALKEASLPEDGKTVLYDGRIGEPFDQRVTVGYIYMMKLHHLVADKIHARATGPYSLITQQPLGGKARNGGQRFGEMEVWALEAYGAAHVLQEMLTVKSDDVDGRTKIYESMVKGESRLEPGMPVSFEVLMNEIRGLGLNMRLEKGPRKLTAG